MGAWHAMRIGMTWLLTALPATATTWVVDDNGGAGVDFVNIQAAVDAAVDGDVIEVRAGNYLGFTIDGKSLVVRGIGTSVFVRSLILVKDIDAARRLEFDSIRVTHPKFPATRQTAVILMENPGSVRFVDCAILGMDAAYYRCDTYDDRPRRGLEMSQSEDVTLLRCIVEGGDGPGYGTSYECGYDGATGLYASLSSGVTVLDSSISGGRGGFQDEHDLHVADGGDGAILKDGSTLFAHRSEFQGGAGATGGCDPFKCPWPVCCPDGQHGDGVVLQTPSSMTWKDSTFDSIVPPAAAQEVAIAPYCIGTFEECPCGNHGAGTAGCEHSFGLGGARLEGVGNASVAADTVTLQLTGLNQNGAPTALFFQGTTGSEGTPFNDGLLCASGTVIRMKGKPAANGTVSFGFGQPGDPLVSSAGNVPPAGATRFYQVWYRNNAASFCTPLRFNMSNGVEIAWGP